METPKARQIAREIIFGEEEAAVEGNAYLDPVQVDALRALATGPRFAESAPAAEAVPEAYREAARFIEDALADLREGAEFDPEAALRNLSLAARRIELSL
jgi:hypothetical protein